MTTDLSKLPPELREKIAKEIAAYEASKAAEMPTELDEQPRYVFSRHTTSREMGDEVHVRNGIDESMRAESSSIASEGVTW